MKSINTEAYILSSARIPFAKSQTAYSDVSRKDLMVAALNGLVQKNNLKNKLVDDVSVGAVMNSSADWNLARECVLETELHPETPAYNTQRACGTSLENLWHMALKIHAGHINLGIAGGVDTNSDLPIEVSADMQRFLLDMNKARTFGEKLSALSGLSFKSLIPRPPAVVEARTLMSMGQHCELMVKEWQIPRSEQDQIAYLSHKNGSAAYERGFYNDLVVEFKGLKKDLTLRAETSLEKLAKLKPAFDTTSGQGSLTAGNSSPLTDGAACVLLGSADAASKLGVKPLAKVIDVQVAAVDFVHGAGLLMAPTKAVSQLLTRNKLTFQDFDYLEIHEAFAGQVLCNLKAWESEKYCKEVLGLTQAIGSIDRNRLNTVGSSLALGHPFAATGARIAGTLAKLLSQGGTKRGLISICTAGGMGIAAILESV
jgi:acetyl-CoA C-acetyltransferase